MYENWTEQLIDEKVIEKLNNFAQINAVENSGSYKESSLFEVGQVAIFCNSEELVQSHLEYFVWKLIQFIVRFCKVRYSCMEIDQAEN